MTAASGDRARRRGENLLIAHCTAQAGLEPRVPADERLRQLLGPDLARLLFVALIGDHRMWSRDLAA